MRVSSIARRVLGFAALGAVLSLCSSAAFADQFVTDLSVIQDPITHINGSGWSPTIEVDLTGSDILVDQIGFHAWWHWYPLGPWPHQDEAWSQELYLLIEPPNGDPFEWHVGPQFAPHMSTNDFLFTWNTVNPVVTDVNLRNSNGVWRFSFSQLWDGGGFPPEDRNYQLTDVQFRLTGPAVPEPATLALLAIGGLALLRKRG